MQLPEEDFSPLRGWSAVYISKGRGSTFAKQIVILFARLKARKISEERKENRSCSGSRMALCTY